MVEERKSKIDIRILKDRDPELFELFDGSFPAVKVLRELVAEKAKIEAENQDLKLKSEQMKNDLTGIKLSARQAQKNTEMTLGILNSWLFSQQVHSPFSRREKQHPYLAYFETDYRRMLDDIAQRKVYKDKEKNSSAPTSDATFLDHALSDDNPF
jgi:hypothetical protein